MNAKLFFKKGKWFLKNIQNIRDYAARNFYEEIENRNIIANSRFFDPDYYRRNNPELDNCKDLALHYLKKGGFTRLDPSEFFCSEEYFSLHTDLFFSELNPLLAYEKYGREINYEISTLQSRKDFVFPDEAIKANRFYCWNPAQFKRTAIVSCFVSDGIIPDTLIILLKGIKAISDNIILIGDCPIIPRELDKLEELVSYAKFCRHHQYDFGSYKEGLKYFRQMVSSDSDSVDEIIMLNDSCFGPVYPFEESFSAMKDTVCDFWGLSGYLHDTYHYFKSHVSSYFFVFRKSVISTTALDEFFNKITGSYSRDNVITCLETEFTNYLEKRGFLWRTICKDFSLDVFKNASSMVMKYRLPLVKKKAFERITILNENLDDVLSIIRKNNPELSEYIHINPIIHPDFIIPSISEHQTSFKEKLNRLSQKYKSESKLTILFLISDYNSFSGKQIFNKMLLHSAFDTYIAVIPDFQSEPNDHMGILIKIAEQEKAIISDNIEEKRLIRIRPDHFGNWPDICENMDIVCYNTPYSYSSFRYLPRYSIGRDFLPVLVNDDALGHPYDTRILEFDAYRYAWKVLFSDPKTTESYKIKNLEGGKNAELIQDLSSDEDAAEKAISKFITTIEVRQ